jgi:hypothetical protein
LVKYIGEIVFVVPLVQVGFDQVGKGAIFYSYSQLGLPTDDIRTEIWFRRQTTMKGLFDPFCHGVLTDFLVFVTVGPLQSISYGLDDAITLARRRLKELYKIRSKNRSKGSMRIGIRVVVEKKNGWQ